MRDKKRIKFTPTTGKWKTEYSPEDVRLISRKQSINIRFIT